MIELNKNVCGVIIAKTVTSGGAPLIRIHIILKRLVYIRGFFREFFAPSINGIANDTGSLKNKFFVIYDGFIVKISRFHIQDRRPFMEPKITVTLGCGLVLAKDP